MSADRRKFLKLAGLTAIGLAGGKAANLLADDSLEVVPPGTLPALSPEPGKPLVGKRWAMVVDLHKCAAEGNCDKCTKACHVTHNVPNFPNKKDEIKWIWKESFEHAFHEQEHEHISEEVRHLKTPVLCNHCDNPPCVRVCPTQATWKREQDGIVMMDWHRCIGCRYCVAACPYGSRSFNYRDPRPFIEKTQEDFPTRMRGVVEKCNFCVERVSFGLLPACVEATGSTGAMVFGDLNDEHSEISKVLRSSFTIQRKPSAGTMPSLFYII